MREIILFVATAFFGYVAFCLWRRIKRPSKRSARILIGISAFLCTLLSAALLLVFLGFMYYYHRPQPKSISRPLFQGVNYIRDVRKTPRPVVIHVLSVNLKTPGLHILVTPSNEERLPARTTSEFAREFGTQVAVNANCFEPCYTNSALDFFPRSGDMVKVLGNAASEGVVYCGGHRPTLSLSFTDDNTAAIGEELPNATQTVSGTHQILTNGKIAEGLPDSIHPRTAAALSQDKNTLLIIVADGRQPNYSEGLTLEELATITLEHGGYHAINLDGGGSSAMVVTPFGKRPHALNSPVHTGIPGRERPVVNHLGIFAPELED